MQQQRPVTVDLGKQTRLKTQDFMNMQEYYASVKEEYKLRQKLQEEVYLKNQYALNDLKYFNVDEMFKEVPQQQFRSFNFNTMTNIVKDDKQQEQKKQNKSDHAYIQLLKVLNSQQNQINQIKSDIPISYIMTKQQQLHIQVIKSPQNKTITPQNIVGSPNNKTQNQKEPNKCNLETKKDHQRSKSEMSKSFAFYSPYTNIQTNIQEVPEFHEYKDKKIQRTILQQAKNLQSSVEKQKQNNKQFQTKLKKMYNVNPSSLAQQKKNLFKKLDDDYKRSQRQSVYKINLRDQQELNKNEDTQNLGKTKEQIFDEKRKEIMNITKKLQDLQDNMKYNRTTIGKQQKRQNKEIMRRLSAKEPEILANEDIQRYQKFEDTINRQNTIITSFFGHQTTSEFNKIKNDEIFNQKIERMIFDRNTRFSDRSQIVESLQRQDQSNNLTVEKFKHKIKLQMEKKYTILKEKYSQQIQNYIKLIESLIKHNTQRSHYLTVVKNIKLILDQGKLVETNDFLQIIDQIDWNEFMDKKMQNFINLVIKLFDIDIILYQQWFDKNLLKFQQQNTNHAGLSLLGPRKKFTNFITEPAVIQ